MSEQKWRLITGKISRPNKDGIMETHRAPYDFIPTDTELKANQFRMRPVGATPELSKEVPQTIIVERKHNPSGKKADNVTLAGPVTLTEKHTGQRTEKMQITQNVFSTETRTPEQIATDTAAKEKERKTRADEELRSLLSLG